MQALRRDLPRQRHGPQPMSPWRPLSLSLSCRGRISFAMHDETKSIRTGRLVSPHVR